MVCSASRSNCVTGEPSDLRSAVSLSLRKPARINSDGARAASIATSSRVGSSSFMGKKIGPTASQVKQALRKLGSPERAAGVARFFKTGKGQYGEGDVFIGCTVPEERRIARAFRDLSLADSETLLTSKVHEDRATALIILVEQFRASQDEAFRQRVYRLYMKRRTFINNWDLVDGSADPIVGGWLADKDRDVLDALAASKHL